MIDYDTLKNWHFADVLHRYDADDTMRYALALGAGADPTDARQLRFVNDVLPGTPVALPTMAVVLGFPGSWMNDLRTGIDFPRIVHGEELLVMHRPLAAAGSVVARHRVTRIVDKGEGRGATITYDKTLFDEAGGDLLATVTHTTFARGDGGFARAGHPGDDAPPARPPMPDRTPDAIVELATLPQQALMYRLCADRNPLHAEPAVAVAAGFERPILHGLCTYGIAGRAVLACHGDDDPGRLQRLSARFSAPVYPGETLRFEMFAEAGAIRFRAFAKARECLVLDQGLAVLAAQVDA